ncbi:hypothetical protein O3G_MSEX009864 [Manduca sexta]|uniref:Nucleoporin Nup58 n=1 Tax=Manduca sexta TaxID=7130 RepID=A0A921ZF76_MANSE|nr:hypothetical protein O3G_MSEX009864 [Manduca sexta]
MSFAFGTPSSAPATSSLTEGFSFGANKQATPGFGLTATSQPSTGLFGTPAASAAPTFGTPAFASTTPAFGATSVAPGFGSTTTPAFGSTPAFGTTPGFGASSATSAFGTATPAFGSTTNTFGSTATGAFGATSAAPTFGATTAPGFGTTGLGTGGLNFGAGTNTGTPATGLSFGTPATTASTGLGGAVGFGFGTTTSQSTGFGLLGSTSTATTSTSIFATPSLGLGGTAPTTGAGGTTAADAKSEPPKQTKLPNQIATNVESFKEFVKKQKALSSEVMRVSIKPLNKVAREVEGRAREVSSLSGAVSRARARSRRLRAAAAAALAAADAAARHLAEPGSELESTSPPQYVKELISELEQQLITFRRQMEVADKQMQSSPKLLTEQELTLGIRRMHESLVALAGRLQAVHAQVDAQKEQYLNLRKYILKDPTNVFDTPYPNTSLDQIIRDADNNTKKLKTGISDLSRSSVVMSDPRAVLGGSHHLAGPSPFCYVGGGLSPFPGADASGSSWQPQPQLNTGLSMTGGSDAPTFNLQKPPGKRGKQ